MDPEEKAKDGTGHKHNADGVDGVDNSDCKIQIQQFLSNSPGKAVVLAERS